MSTTTQLIWNGCDCYIDAHVAFSCKNDYNMVRTSEGHILYHASEEFSSFPAVEIAIADVPRDADGELDFDELFVTEDRRIYRAA